MKFGDTRTTPPPAPWTITFSSFARNWKRTLPARYISALYTEWDTNSFVDSLEPLAETRSQQQPGPVHRGPAAQTAIANPLPALDAPDHGGSDNYQPATGAAKYSTQCPPGHRRQPAQLSEYLREFPA